MSQTSKEILKLTAPKKKARNKQYFTKDTEEAILMYNQMEDEIDRNRLYVERIKYPFDKLVENMIHTFKFYHFDVGRPLLSDERLLSKKAVELR
jgi:hypothetical protein